MLQRRPDVRAAEAELAAYTADIGVQKAEMYPRFSLTSSLGQQAKSVGDLADSTSTRFSLGTVFSWPIFSFGRLRAQVRAADARAQAALARYERAVLGALTDSETAANRYQASLEMLESRAAALAEATRAEDLAGRRFRLGEDDRVQFLESQSARLAAETQVVEAKRDAAASFIAFSKSLGGGVA